MKIYYAIFVLVFLIGCASDPSNSKSNDYLSEKDNESLEDLIDTDVNNSLDLFPIPATNIKSPQLVYDLPLPKQFFSADNSNEIRLHSLGEIRWIYLGLEPSKVWPIMREYFETDSFITLENINANLGTMESQEFDHFGKRSKIQFKLERGLQRESSELFISHLVLQEDTWAKEEKETDLIENNVKKILDFFSNSGPVSGTSLVALNLNNEDKAFVFEDDKDGDTKIKVMISYPRAWAAVERSIKIAGFELVDKNRDEGKFYLSWKGESSFFGRNQSNRLIQVKVEKMEEDISIISVFMENKDLEVSREIISQLNQVLT